MSKNVKAEFLKNGKIRLIRDFGIVPRGFICDGASVPRFFWRLFGHPYDRKHIRGGVRHDWGYTIGGDEALRKAIDEQYREDLKADGQGFVLRWLEYFAVRLGGRSHYNNTEKGKTMKKLMVVAALAALGLAAGCRVVEVENRGEGIVLDKEGAPVLVDGKIVKYSKGWNVYHNQHWMATEADSMEAHIKPEDISFSMNKLSTAPSEELNKLVDTSLKGAAELAAKVGAAIATSGGSVAGEAGYEALKTAISNYISKGGDTAKATVESKDGSVTITDGNVSETCADCVAK